MTIGSHSASIALCDVFLAFAQSIDQVFVRWFCCKQIKEFNNSNLLSDARNYCNMDGRPDFFCFLGRLRILCWTSDNFEVPRRLHFKGSV
jgi:hypothetical protein